MRFREVAFWILMAPIFALPPSVAAETYEATQTIASPDGRVEIAFMLDNGVPFYAITRDGRGILRKSF